mmetsp:Transcript_11905/g.37851  ORF Transcript_11905/g.37851 Transcript_11905/m.37851 type:complete len:226 (-) Transcript_11905:1441-2118(-)
MMASNLASSTCRTRYPAGSSRRTRTLLTRYSSRCSYESQAHARLQPAWCDGVRSCSVLRHRPRPTYASSTHRPSPSMNATKRRSATRPTNESATRATRRRTRRRTRRSPKSPRRGRHDRFVGRWCAIVLFRHVVSCAAEPSGVTVTMSPVTEMSVYAWLPWAARSIICTRRLVIAPPPSAAADARAHACTSRNTPCRKTDAPRSSDEWASRTKWLDSRPMCSTVA